MFLSREDNFFSLGGTSLPKKNNREKKKELDRIEPVSRVEALIPDDVILIRSRSLDIGYGDLDDATSSEGSDV